MIKLLISALFIFSIGFAHALTRSDVERMLAAKNVSLRALEGQGAVMLLGEVTGHGRSVPLEKVEAILTEKDVILSHEIESVSPNGARNLSQSDSIRAQGQYILREDVKATILRK